MPAWQGISHPHEPEPSPTIALAGAGRIASVHGLAARALGIAVTSVASRQGSNASRLADELGARTCTYDDLPAGADLVVVATPPALHCAHALRAMAGGAGVLVEKPLCTTLAQADLLVEAEARGEGPLLYAENLAFAPSVGLALAEIAQMGPLVHLEVRAVQARPDWGDFLTTGWGGGVLFDLGSHPLALCLLAAAPAEPIAVRATLQGAPDHAVDEWAEVHVSFEGGLEARVVASWRDPEGAWDLEAASQDGVVRLEILPTPGLERDGEPLALPPSREGIELEVLDRLGYLGELEAALGALRALVPRKETTGHLGATFGREVIELICAAYRSAGRGGEPVALPFEGPRDMTPLELWQRG